MRRIAMIGAVALAQLGLLAGNGMAQVVREGDVKSIAGVLKYAAPPQVSFAEWTFTSSGYGDLLLASLDADIYRMNTEVHGTVTAAEGGSSGGGEEDTGPGVFRLSVIDSAGKEVCAATRAAPPPGWQRDPRMACHLPLTYRAMTYRVRVQLANVEVDKVQPSYPFVLNLSLRMVAASGIPVESAVAQSANRM